MKSAAAWLLTASVLAACGPAAPTPARQATPIVVVVTAAPAPTLPPAPAAEPTATEAEPTAEPTAMAAIGPDEYPAGINPLTGLAVDDPSVLLRRPLAVKVSQFPRRVRPQAGLSRADLVFEHYAEAGITRMTAIYLSQGAEQVGSIRSARLIDKVLMESYGALLVTSGTSEGTLAAMRRTDYYHRVIAEATGYNDCPPLCREGEAASTDNLFGRTEELWQLSAALGLDQAQDLRGLAFAPEPPPGGQPAATLRLEFLKDFNVTEWRFDPVAGRYARWVDTANIAAGELAPHLDRVDGSQLSAANVVVLYAHHQPTDIVEDLQSGGHCGYEIQIWGTGPARLFRDGQAYDATWQRLTLNQPIRFLGADGSPLRLKPGNTWFEILTLNSPSEMADGLFTARFKGLSQSTRCPIPPQPTPTP